MSNTANKNTPVPLDPSWVCPAAAAFQAPDHPRLAATAVQAEATALPAAAPLHKGEFVTDFAAGPALAL